MSNQKTITSTDALNLFAYNVAGIYETNVDGDLLTFNQAFAELMGYSDDELSSINGDALYESSEERRKFIKEILQKGRVKNREIVYCRKDGSRAWCIENAFLTERDGMQVIIGTLTDITEQRINADRFQSLFYASGDAIIIIEEGKVIQYNKRCCELFGYDNNELTGIDAFALTGGLFHMSNEERDLILTSLCDEFGGIRRICTLSQRKDGSHFHCELTISRFSTEACAQNQVIIRDISERMLHEEELKESETRFKLLSEVAIEGVVFVVDDRIQDCNLQFVKLFGYSKPEELLGKSILDLISEGDVKRLKQILELKSFNKIEISTRQKDGHFLFLEATGSKIEYRHQDVHAFLFYNITSRKRTEQALEQSTTRFKSLVEQSPNGIFILLNGRIQYVNQGGLNLLKFEEEDAIFDDLFYDFFPGKDQKQLRDDLSAVREGEEIEQKEYRILASDGQEVVVGLMATLTVYDGNPAIQVTLNNLNTQMKLMQETLRAQLAEEINTVLKHEIEEHKLTQKKLRQAENYTRNIIQSSLDMISAMDANGKITEFNLAAQKQFGYTQKQILGKGAEILYANKADFKRVSKSIIESGTYTGEILNVTRDGKEFTGFLSASLIKNDDGELIGSMGVSRDITEVKKAEQELRDSEERYRDLFENATDFIFSVDMNGKFLYANRSFLETLKYKAGELEKLNLSDVVPGVSKKGDLLKKFAGKTLELDFHSKNGKEFRVFGDSSIRYNGKKPDSIRAIYRDITDLRRHEQVATEQAAKLESVFNSTENLMMWTMNLKGELTSFNNNFLRWMKEDFDYKPRLGDDIIARMGKEVNANAYQGQLRTFNAAFSGEPRQFELPLASKKSSAIWFQVFVNPVRVKDRMEEVSCLAYDITDRKEMDRKILASLKEKEVLLQEVHHRVKNNLQVISSILNLQSSFVSDENVLSILKESQSRIKTMSYIHETLYQTADFSSIEFTDYISSLARNLVQSYAPGDTSIALELDFDEIYLDLDQAIPCGLIINELVSNALKYAFQGTKSGTLTISIKEEGDRIAMTITDNGIGLPDDFKYQDSESLGIYLVYALIEQIDAEIRVESERNQGTRFLITFEKQVQKK